MLKTFSGTPYLSVEQRNHFNKQRDDLIKEMPELLTYNDIHRFPLWTLLDWATFLKHDSHQIGQHPIHTAFESLYEYRRTYNKRIHELQLAYDAQNIDAELFEVLKFELKMNLDYVESQFDVKAKKTFDIRYGGKETRQKFVECLQRTVNERLSALANKHNQSNPETTVEN
jgi:hypothetical protein